MKACYFGTYRDEYSRNRIMIAALRAAGIEVIECHESLWYSIQDRVDATVGGWKRPAFWWRVIKTYWKLLRKYSKTGDYDVLMVGYPGQFDIYLAKFLARLKHRPLVWDVFMSIYLVAVERRLQQRDNFSVNLLRKIEAAALKKPDLLIQDTAEYVEWFRQQYNISPDRFRLIPTGADSRVFYPVEVQPFQDGKFHVLYSGTYIPNHGVQLIMQAAKALQAHPDIVFNMIGEGPERQGAEDFIRSNNLSNVCFSDWVAQEELVRSIQKSDVCLGAFGDTPQSLMTVQNKLYECMAVGKPVITGKSPATRHLEDLEVIKTCSREDPQELAEAILWFRENPAMAEAFGKRAREFFIAHCSIEQLGASLSGYLVELLSEFGKRR